MSVCDRVRVRKVGSGSQLGYRENASLGQIEFPICNLWARGRTSGPDTPKSGRFDQVFSIWAREKRVARPDFEPARTRSGPGAPRWPGPDLFLAQIAFFWSRSKIDLDQRNSDPDQRKSDLAQRNPIWPRENPIWARCKIRLGQTIWCIMDQIFWGPEPGLAREPDQTPCPGDRLRGRPDGLLDLIPQKYKRGALLITKRHHSASG